MPGTKKQKGGLTAKQHALIEDMYNFELEPPEYDNSPVTIDNWRSYGFKEDYSVLWGYYEANKHFTDVLETRCATATNFEELKAEITALIAEKRKFIEYAYEHMVVE